MVAIHILKLRLSFLAHDLRAFKSNPRAEARLSASVAPHNIGPPYLTEQEALEALATPSHKFRSIDSPNCQSPEEASETLGAFLDRRLGEVLSRRHANNGDKPDFVLCASHDLAPLLQAALGLERGFDDAKEFKRAYKNWNKRC